ncbi:MAG: UDP-N-acetylmuramoyl-tripeptide--D-alanyl-D-alanine ligase [Defluviitaleaceae bacterium]|nr:UDP-N-acetylmuramoyl-tripeptide--D-alanyl-D-alanine ligase [Defluviitaleaceae bacterium]
MNLTIREIISACNGGFIACDFAERAGQAAQRHEGKIVTSISIDTRTITPGALFVPLKGENSDGHEFLKQAEKNGAICVLSEQQNAPSDMDIPIIYVRCTRRALMDIAAMYRRRCGVKVVAITGSAGKTTTKDMTAQIAAQKYKTKSTIKNYNNDIGVPLSIFQLEQGDEVLVLEMGMNHANELHELSLIGKPDIAVITHIGDSHIENLGSREGILRAKLEILDGVRLGSTIVLNGDDPLLTGAIAAKKTRGYNVLLPCSENIVTEPLGFDGTRCWFNWRGQAIHITVPLPGRHMAMNALMACVVGLELGVTPAQISAAFENFVPPSGRLNIFEFNGIRIIDDVYNASPSSMREAIKILCGAKGRRVAVLGDMFELGGAGQALHREVGELAAQSGVDLLITVGTLSRWINEGFNSDCTVVGMSPRSLNGLPTGKREAYHYDTLGELDINEHIRRGDTVLLKASNGMRFGKLAELFRG